MRRNFRLHLPNGSVSRVLAQAVVLRLSPEFSTTDPSSTASSVSRPLRSIFFASDPSSSRTRRPNHRRVVSHSKVFQTSPRCSSRRLSITLLQSISQSRIRSAGRSVEQLTSLRLQQEDQDRNLLISKHFLMKRLYPTSGDQVFTPETNSHYSGGH